MCVCVVGGALLLMVVARMLVMMVIHYDLRLQRTTLRACRVMVTAGRRAVCVSGAGRLC